MNPSEATWTFLFVSIGEGNGRDVLAVTMLSLPLELIQRGAVLLITGIET